MVVQFFQAEQKEPYILIKIKTSNTEGYVHCEKMKLFDLNVRGFSKIDSLSISDLIDITDAIQSIFDNT